MKNPTKLGNAIANGAICVALTICLVSLVSVVWADAAARERNFTMSWYDASGTGGCGESLAGRHYVAAGPSFACGARIRISYHRQHTTGIVLDRFGTDVPRGRLDAAPAIWNALGIPLSQGIARVKVQRR